MKKIYYATSGDQKYEEIKDLIPDNIEIEKIPLNYPEDQTDDTDGIAIFGARWLANKENIPVIVDDMGLFIKACGGFPGPYVKYISKKLKPKGILKLLDGEKNRDAFFKVSVAFCEPGKKPIVFSAKRIGKITNEITSGPYDYGLNSIFMPDDSEKTLAQFSFEDKIKNEPRREAFKKLIQSVMQDMK